MYWSGWCCSQKHRRLCHRDILWHVHFPVASFWCPSYLGIASLDTCFHKHHFVSCTCIKVQGKKFLWKKSLLGVNFFQGVHGETSSLLAFQGIKGCLLQSHWNAFRLVKQNQERDIDVKLLLLYRSCYSCGGNLNLVVDTLFLRTTKEIVFIRPTPSFLLKAVSGFHVYFQIKLETLLPRPPSADSDGLHNLINNRHS